jgi:hypothetical protein
VDTLDPRTGQVSEIHQEVDKLKQGEDFTVKLWTDMAAATEYRESFDIDSDSQKKEKWLKRQEALADRQLELDSMRLSLSESLEENVADQGT